MGRRRLVPGSALHVPLARLPGAGAWLTAPASPPAPPACPTTDPGNFTLAEADSFPQLKNNGSFLWPTVVIDNGGKVRAPALPGRLRRTDCLPAGTAAPRPSAATSLCRPPTPTLGRRRCLHPTRVQVVLTDDLMYHDGPRCSPQTVEVRRRRRRRRQWGRAHASPACCLRLGRLAASAASPAAAALHPRAPCPRFCRRPWPAWQRCSLGPSTRAACAPTTPCCPSWQARPTP